MDWREIPGNERALGKLKALVDAREAVAFVADEDRRACCEAQLSFPRFSFYLNEVGLFGASAGEFSSAMSQYDAAEAGFRRAGHARSLSLHLQNQTGLLTTLGRLADADAKAREALALARESEATRCYALAYHGAAPAQGGGVSDAMAAFDEANAIEKRDDPDDDELYSARGVKWADLLSRLGRTARARALTEANVKICERNGWQDDVARCRWILGRLDAGEGRLDSAVAQLAAAEGTMRRGHQLMDLPRVLLARSDVERRRGEWETAWRYVEEALRIAMPR